MGIRKLNSTINGWMWRKSRFCATQWVNGVKICNFRVNLCMLLRHLPLPICAHEHRLQNGLCCQVVCLMTYTLSSQRQNPRPVKENFSACHDRTPQKVESMLQWQEFFSRVSKAHWRKFWHSMIRINNIWPKSVSFNLKSTTHTPANGKPSYHMKTT